MCSECHISNEAWICEPSGWRQFEYGNNQSSGLKIARLLSFRVLVMHGGLALSSHLFLARVDRHAHGPSSCAASSRREVQHEPSSGVWSYSLRRRSSCVGCPQQLPQQ